MCMDEVFDRRFQAKELSHVRADSAGSARNVHCLVGSDKEGKQMQWRV